MRKIVGTLCKIIVSGILSIAILSIVCLAYSYNTQAIPTPTGVSICSWVPGSLKTKMDEGVGWNVMDANGYNNEMAYDKVDILIMGGSHIEALQMDRSKNVTYKLDEMLPQYHVYNVGIDGHSIEICANYLENACGYFSPKYVVIDVNSLELDESNMNSVMSGTYQAPELLTVRRPLVAKFLDSMPALPTLIHSFQEWQKMSSLDKTNLENKSDYEDSKYVQTLNCFIQYLGDIARTHDTQLILLYHPASYEVDEQGELVFEDETEAFNIFSDICNENDIVLVSTKNENIKMYEEKHVVPNGFANTRLGSGHLNKYGHTAMANVLYETIKDLEN